MNDKEKIPRSDSAHVYVAMSRRKENPNSTAKVHRVIIRNHIKDLEYIRKIVKQEEGVWRIYKSVNERCFIKALKMFKHKLIDSEDDYLYRIDSLWKKCLMNPKCRAEKNFLIDVDTKDDKTLQKVVDIVNKELNILLLITDSPNGYHCICRGFDIRKLEGIENVSIVKDGLVYMETIENEVNKNE